MDARTRPFSLLVLAVLTCAVRSADAQTVMTAVCPPGFTALDSVRCVETVTRTADVESPPNPTTPAPITASVNPGPRVPSLRPVPHRIHGTGRAVGTLGTVLLGVAVGGGTLGAIGFGVSYSNCSFGSCLFAGIVGAFIGAIIGGISAPMLWLALTESPSGERRARVGLRPGLSPAEYGLGMNVVLDGSF